MREGGDSRYSHSSPQLMTNDECHASFVWAFVFVRGQPFSCVGNGLCVWATIFMRGQLSSCVGDHLCAWWSFLCMSGRFCAWAVSLTCGWLLALVGWLLRMGSLSCGSAGTIVEGWVVLTMLKNNNEGCHVTDSDVAPCSMCFACMLRLSWLCGVCVGGCGVWRWMVRAGGGG